MDYLWSPWRMTYIQNNKKEASCVFCTVMAQADGLENLVVHRDKHSFVILNRYPYTSGHLMVVPFLHRASLDQLDLTTRTELMEQTNRAVQILQSIYQPQGFNIGINIGEAAGAGIENHIHIHIVPRWNGDTNFMTTLGTTRVLPESLEDSYQRINIAWAAFQEKH